MINVRRATIDDFESIVAIYVAAWRSGFEYMFSPTVFESADFDRLRREECDETVFSENSDTYVAEHDGRVVGFSVSRSVDRSIELDDIWVHPSSWGCGAASALVGRVEHDLRSLGGNKLIAWVPEDSPRGRYFFEKVGWRPTGSTAVLDVYAHDRNRLIEYERLLAPTDMTRGLPRPAVRL